MSELLEALTKFWHDATAIWSAGGWAMWAIAAISLLMFGMGVHIYLRLLRKGFRSVPEGKWRRWIDHPRERHGTIGRLLDRATSGRTVKEASELFVQLRATEMAPLERDLRIMKVCVSAAPLVGLLGTVTGMLATFEALSAGSGGDKTLAMIAAGIAEALVTTETGLVIALPGLFFQYMLERNFQGYQAFMAHLETVCTQTLHRQTSRQNDLQVRRAARSELATRLQRAVS